MKKVIGTIITVVVGGVIYNINSVDVAKHFAEDTGMTQQQAEQYVDNVSEKELASFDEVGKSLIEDSQVILNELSNIDCVNYEYEWESDTLTCSQVKTQIEKICKDDILLGQSYKILGSASASKDDISITIKRIEQSNLNLELKAIGVFFDRVDIDEFKLNHSYNKAILQAILESN